MRQKARKEEGMTKALAKQIIRQELAQLSDEEIMAVALRWKGEGVMGYEIADELKRRKPTCLGILNETCVYEDIELFAKLYLQMDESKVLTQSIGLNVKEILPTTHGEVLAGVNKNIAEIVRWIANKENIAQDKSSTKDTVLPEKADIVLTVAFDDSSVDKTIANLRCKFEELLELFNRCSSANA
jgi:hypothetical protein